MNVKGLPQVWERLKRLASRAAEDQGLTTLLQSCRKLISERGQANLYALAREVIEAWTALPAARRGAFFAVLATEFSPDPLVVKAAADAYVERPDAAALRRLTEAVEPSRQELLRRINRTDGGIRTVLAMRRALMDVMRQQPGLESVDADFLHLLSSWFNPGFLALRSVSWESSAALLEKLIEHEAVHAIAGWDDLRRRLEPDRRCYAFFHPQLPGEPLIFVEVALTDHLPEAIAPLIDSGLTRFDPTQADTAIFYSISNCQPGLRGVSLGNFLIKKVADELRREFPGIQTFATLSPVPGLARWLAGLGDDANDGAAPGTQGAERPDAGQHAARLPAPLAAAAARVRAWLKDRPTVSRDDIETLSPELAADLRRLGAHYLVRCTHDALADPVARFHLDNGARLERVNLGADLSRKGLKQSLSLMVNYRYELDAVEARHQAFIDGEVTHSTAVRKLLPRP